MTTGGVVGMDHVIASADQCQRGIPSWIATSRSNASTVVIPPDHNPHCERSTADFLKQLLEFLQLAKDGISTPC
jgi:hypothetical protein